MEQNKGVTTAITKRWEAFRNRPFSIFLKGMWPSGTNQGSVKCVDSCPGSPPHFLASGGSTLPPRCPSLSPLCQEKCGDKCEHKNLTVPIKGCQQRCNTIKECHVLNPALESSCSLASQHSSRTTRPHDSRCPQTKTQDSLKRQFQTYA